MNLPLKGMLPPRIPLTRRIESRTKSWTGSLNNIQVRMALKHILFQKYIFRNTIFYKFERYMSSSVIIDIHIMLFAGFGFLMTFLKNYGYSAISFTVMITVIITEFGILCFGISRFEDEDYTIRITMIECVNKLMLQGPS